MRIVSLIASSTEIICALGFEDRLVGRSHECDYPASILKLPSCSETKFIADGKSYEIDQRIKAILQEGLSVYRVDSEKLKALRPDVIVTQIQCEVCAVSEKDVRQAVCDWTGLAPRIVSLNPNQLSDVWSDIRKVSDALGAPERGETLIRSLTARMDAIHRSSARGGAARLPRVACIEWIEPLMTAGNWIPELVEMAGGRCVFGKAGTHSPVLDWNDLVESDPDLIVVHPCGWDVKKARSEMTPLTSRPDWPSLRAVRTGSVYLLDGNQYFNRPGPRLLESLEILAEIFHPEKFRFGFEGRGWEKL